MARGGELVLEQGTGSRGVSEHERVSERVIPTDRAGIFTPVPTGPVG